GSIDHGNALVRSSAGRRFSFPWRSSATLHWSGTSFFRAAFPEGPCRAPCLPSSFFSSLLFLLLLLTRSVAMRKALRHPPPCPPHSLRRRMSSSLTEGLVALLSKPSASWVMAVNRITPPTPR